MWLINPTAQATEFRLPGRARDAQWQRLLDSAGDSTAPAALEGACLLQPHHSLLLERSERS
jgi:hypothetical protein